MEIVFSSVSLKHPGSSEILLKDFSYQILPGKIIGICGEHVLQIMKMMSFLLPITEGQIKIDGKIVTERGKDFDKKIGYIAESSIFTNDTVQKELEQIYLAYYEKDGMEKKIKEACKMALFPSRLLLHHPNTLSTTEKKKLMLTKALIQNPDIYFLEDFPYGLCYKEQEYYKKLFRKLSQSYDKTVVISTNQTDFFLNMIDELLVFGDKKMAYQGNKSIFYNEEIYQYIDCPEIISCIFYLRSKGHRIENYYEVKELLKAIYRDVA